MAIGTPVSKATALRLQLVTVAIGTVLLTTSALADDTTPFAGIVLVVPASSTATPTLVQQLTAKLAYQLEELAEYPNNTYYGPASKRTAKKLAAAIAAAASGTPMPPMLSENGGVVPIGKFGSNHVEAPATPVPYAAGLLRVAKSLAVATSEGTLSLTPDTGLPSANPDTGLPSSNPDTTILSSNPEGGGSSPSSPISSVRNAMAVNAAGSNGKLSSNPDTGVASSNPDTGIESSNPDGALVLPAAAEKIPKALPNKQDPPVSNLLDQYHSRIPKFNIRQHLRSGYFADLREPSSYSLSQSQSLIRPVFNDVVGL